jgi:hypothetical protein
MKDSVTPKRAPKAVSKISPDTINPTKSAYIILNMLATMATLTILPKREFYGASRNLYKRMYM